MANAYDNRRIGTRVELRLGSDNVWRVIRIVRETLCTKTSGRKRFAVILTPAQDAHACCRLRACYTVA